MSESVVISDDAVDIAAQSMLEWARDQSDEAFDTCFPGIDAMLNALTEAGIVPPDFQERLINAVRELKREDEINNMEDFLAP